MAGLSLSQELEEVNLGFCDQIPASVWQQLRGAKWPKLKKANFAWYLARERTGWRMLKVFECFFGQCVLSTVQYCSRLDHFSKFRVNVIFLDIADCMTWPFTKHLQVLPKPRGGCSRSSRSPRVRARAGSGEFQWMFSDPGGCVAEAERCEVAQAEEGLFRFVPCRERNGWRCLCFFWQCVLNTVYIQYLSHLEHFSKLYSLPRAWGCQEYVKTVTEA